MTSSHYPSEYEAGEVIFFGHRFQITPDVLIPRLETEGLVRRARRLLQTGEYERVLDIGTGSGNIIASVVVEGIETEYIGIDISEPALDVARSNFQALHDKKIKCQFLQSDLLPDVPSSILSGSILILANLPYIRGGDLEHMSPDTVYEPPLALFGGKTTGFELYEKLFDQLKLPDSLNTTLIIEFGFDQREIAEDVLEKYNWKYEFFSDYAGIERFAEINLLTLYE